MEIRLATDIYRRPASLLLSCALASSLCPIAPQVAFANAGSDAAEESQFEASEDYDAESDEVEDELDYVGEKSGALDQVGEIGNTLQSAIGDEYELSTPQETNTANNQALQSEPISVESTPTEANEIPETASAQIDDGFIVVDGIGYEFRVVDNGISISRISAQSGEYDEFAIPASLMVDGAKQDVVEVAWSSTSSIIAKKVIVPAGVRVVDLSGLAVARTECLVVSAGATLDGIGLNEDSVVSSITIGSGAYVNMSLSTPLLTDANIADDARVLVPLEADSVNETPITVQEESSNQIGEFYEVEIQNGRQKVKYQCIKDSYYTYYFTTLGGDKSNGLVFSNVTQYAASDTLRIPSSITDKNGATYNVVGIKWTGAKAQDESYPYAKKLVIPALSSGNSEEKALNNIKNCTSISVIELESGANVVNSNAASNKVELSGTYSLVIGDNCTVGFRFDGGLSSVSVGEGVQFSEATGGGIFEGAANLTTVQFGNSELKPAMFKNCTSLSSFTWAKGDSFEVPKEAFDNCALSSFPFNQVHSIGANAFTGNKFEELSLPESVTSIGSSAFSACSSLRSVDLKANVSPELSGDAWFTGCTALSSLTVGAQVGYIPTTAFQNASSGMKIWNKSNAFKPLTSEELADVTLISSDGSQIYPYKAPPEGYSIGIVNINQYFNTESGLLSIPGATEVIGRSIFNSHLFRAEFNGVPVKQITLDPDNKSFTLDANGVLYTKDMTTVLKAPCNLKTITLPNTVTTIRREAFMDCALLEEVVLPEGLKTIEDQAFRNCSNLKRIDLPSSVTHIGDGAFESVPFECFVVPSSLWASSSADSFIEDGGVPSVNSIFYGWDFGPAAISKHVQLGNGVSALDLSSYSASFIPHFAFAGLGNITEIVIPSTVRDIGTGSFYECNNLSTVYWYQPDAVTVKSGGSGRGDSGSGDASESYAISIAGSFSHWNDEKHDSSGIGSRFEDSSGLVFYGNAGNKALADYCLSYGQRFIPIVVLETLDGAKNPFWNRTMDSSYSTKYGEGTFDYDFVQVQDIAVGGTPQVVTKFSRYDGTRDLTDDPACTISYFDADGNSVTSFTKEGEYTASIVGDNKSVFGSRQIKFYVGERPQEAAEEPSEEPVDSTETQPQAQPAAQPQAQPQPASQVRTVYQTVYTSAPAAVQQEDATVFPVDTADADVAAVLAQHAGKDETLLFWGGANSASPLYVWQVPGTAITEANAKTLNFHVADATSDKELSQQLRGVDYTAFEVKQAGRFPRVFTLYWKTSSTFYDGAKVDVYRYTAGSADAGSAAQVVERTAGMPLVERAYADTGYAAGSGSGDFELVQSGLTVTDGYVSFDVDRGGVYVVAEAGADLAATVAGGFVEQAYADTGELASAEAPARDGAPGWALPTAVAAAVAAVGGLCAAVFGKRRRPARAGSGSAASGGDDE